MKTREVKYIVEVDTGSGWQTAGIYAKWIDARMEVKRGHYHNPQWRRRIVAEETIHSVTLSVIRCYHAKKSKMTTAQQLLKPKE